MILYKDSSNDCKILQWSPPPDPEDEEAVEAFLDEHYAAVMAKSSVKEKSKSLTAEALKEKKDNRETEMSTRQSAVESAKETGTQPIPGTSGAPSSRVGRVAPSARPPPAEVADYLSRLAAAGTATSDDDDTAPVPAKRRRSEAARKGPPGSHGKRSKKN